MLMLYVVYSKTSNQQGALPAAADWMLADLSYFEVLWTASHFSYT